MTRPEITSRHFLTCRQGRPARVACLLVLGLLVGLFVTGALVSAHRRAALRDLRDEAVRAVWAARRAGAARWAPEALGHAETAARAATIAQRVEEVKLLTLAGASDVASAWGRVRNLAARAAEQALRHERAARLASEQALTQTDQLLAHTAVVADVVRLGAERDVALRRAQLYLIEARSLDRQGRYEEAKRQAELAASLAEPLSTAAAGVAGRYLEQRIVATWERWRGELIAWSSRKQQAAVLVEKANHRLILFVNGKPVHTYAVELGSNWVPDKSHSGDAATPEGRYRIVAVKGRGETAYHKALLLDYPNAEDRAAFASARRKGLLPRSARLGGLVEIHGEGGRGDDWTRGCVALSNGDIDDLSRQVAVGTPVTIVGGDGRWLYQAVSRQEDFRSPSPMADVDDRPPR